jgi:hypothetical protein
LRARPRPHTLAVFSKALRSLLSKRVWATLAGYIEGSNRNNPIWSRRSVERLRNTNPAPMRDAFDEGHCEDWMYR